MDNVALVVKNMLANAGNVKRWFGSERSLGGGQGNPLGFSCLKEESPWTGESGKLQSMGSQRVGHD